MDNRKILFCEDEESIRELVAFNLTRSNYDVTSVASGEEAIEAFEEMDQDYPVAILDITLPGIDGFEVLKYLREQSYTMGIIMLSAKSQETDKLIGLSNGADDYITKPFSVSELIARVDTLHRRVIAMSKKVKVVNEDEIVFNPFILNTKSRTLKKNNDYIDLTQVEFQILEIFMSNPGEVKSRKEILETVWGESYFGDEKIVDVNIRRLRIKIEDDSSKPEYILTVWGQGYSFKKAE